MGRFLPLLAAVFAGWLARDVLLGDVSNPSVARVVGLGVRLALIGCGAMALHTYTALVRGPDRAILDPHPVDPGQLLPYLLRRTAAEHWLLLGICGAVSLPLMVAGHTLAFGVVVTMAAGGWSMGLLAGFTIHLGAVWSAESEALASVLEAIRGQNPRLQAALIYAPGAVLAVGGIGIAVAAQGATALLEGSSVGLVGLAFPFLIGALAWLPTPALARAFHFRTTTLLAEIDAQFVGFENSDEVLRVYLDWLVRFVPEGLRSSFLKELRHGWRGLRSWVTAAWGVGLLAAAAAWTSDPTGKVRALVIASAGIWLVGAVALRLSATDPRWLDHALPISTGVRFGGRVLAVSGWLVGVVVPPALVVALRGGVESALWLSGLLTLTLVPAAASGALLSVFRRGGVLTYSSLAILCWGTLLRSVGDVMGIGPTMGVP